jgi:pyridoxal phosphate enzyme (YggS family)
LSSIAQNLNEIRENIENIKTKKNLKQDIKLVAVSKTFPAEAVKDAYEAGQIIFGENRVQEGEEKKNALTGLPLEWHLIGHLQTNKVKKAAEIFDYIHSVDRLRLAQKLSDQCADRENPLPVLLQVNTSGEISKYGMEPDLKIVEDLVSQILELPGLDVRGFMTIGPLSSEESRIRKSFILLREIRDAIQETFPRHSFPELSMGMTGDYEIALEEGATFVRIGSAIFGYRS